MSIIIVIISSKVIANIPTISLFVTDYVSSGRIYIIWFITVATLIVPISVCYYSKLHSALTSYVGVQFLLMKV